MTQIIKTIHTNAVSYEREGKSRPRSFRKVQETDFLLRCACQKSLSQLLFANKYWKMCIITRFMTQVEWAKLFEIKLFSFIFRASGEINLNYELVARSQLCLRRPQQSQYGFDCEISNITTRHLINEVSGEADSLIAHQPVRFVDDKHAEFQRRDEPERSDLFLNLWFIALRYREIEFLKKKIS